MARENESEREKKKKITTTIEGKPRRSSVNETGDFTPTGSLPSAPMNKIQSLGKWARQATTSSAQLKLSQDRIYSCCCHDDCEERASNISFSLRNG